MARRCQGTTRAGKPCSITSESLLTNDSGKIVAEPLRRGGSYCLFHARPFCTRPAEITDVSVVVVLLDLETTGVTMSDRVVEFAAMHCPQDVRFSGGCFSTVVKVDPEYLAQGRAAAAVHGISDEEIAQGEAFPIVWQRFLAWLDNVLNSAVVEDWDSDDEPTPATLKTDPKLLIAGHNAVNFDLPLLMAECLRHGLSCGCFEQWLFMDTLHAVQSARVCKKLQCLVRDLGDPGDLRAHRALDDCIALRHVVTALAADSSLDVYGFFLNFALTVDINSSAAQLYVLMM